MINNLFGGIYKGKKVFITGHSGFKGSWLALWLKELGAIVKGYSLHPNTYPSHWNLLNLDIESVYSDIRDQKRLLYELTSFNPDIVFHLAAQPLVRLSYEDPYSTYETNVLGTLALFEGCRKVNNLKAILNITTDKCYENKEWYWGYRENDTLGGFDPYSSSKACSEILTASYRNSFFNNSEFGIKHQVLLASARAGNVIGGGDWADDRLIPDIIRSASKSEKVFIRNPEATRPWQHVLEPLSGYLLLGQKLLEGESKYADAWNFGPSDNLNLSVINVIKKLKAHWPEVQIKYDNNKHPHEAMLLKLDCSKAHTLLNWQPVWENKVFKKTILWYKDYYQNKKILSKEQLIEYFSDAQALNEIWTK